MSSEFAYDVFLSHSSKDKPVVRDLAERLKADGVRVWFDEWRIQPGDSIPLAIEQGLEQSRTLILIMSGNSLASDWVTLERQTALFRDPTNKQRRFVPVRVDDAEIKDVLKQFAYVDWRNRSNEDYAKLLASCRGRGPDSRADTTGVVELSAEARRSVLRQRAAQLTSTDSRRTHSQASGYYFYISQDKVRKLEQTAPQRPRELDPTVEGILSSVGAGRGRTSEYRKWSSRLVQVLEKIGKSEEICDLGEASRERAARCGWAYAEMDMKLLGREAGLLTLQGRLGAFDVLMSCSASGFLDFDPNRNDLVVTSTNHWFFEGKHPYRFRSHFLILSADNSQGVLRSSPLYLALPIGLLE